MLTGPLRLCNVFHGCCTGHKPDVLSVMLQARLGWLHIFMLHLYASHMLPTPPVRQHECPFAFPDIPPVALYTTLQCSVGVFNVLFPANPHSGHGASVSICASASQELCLSAQRAVSDVFGIIVNVVTSDQHNWCAQHTPYGCVHSVCLLGVLGYSNESVTGC